jgi:hypothetical protein
MPHDETGFYRRGSVSPPRKLLDPEYVHADASQQHEREEERRLPARPRVNPRISAASEFW